MVHVKWVGARYISGVLLCFALWVAIEAWRLLLRSLCFAHIPIFLFHALVSGCSAVVFRLFHSKHKWSVVLGSALAVKSPLFSFAFKLFDDELVLWRKHKS
jgi:hypothetical protein